MTTTMGYCCGCEDDVLCELVSGKDIYPHREDLYSKEFWRCPNCGNYTGKYNGEYPTLASAYIRDRRRFCHEELKSIWKDRNLRGKYYGYMSNIFKRDFHWGTVRSNAEADKALEHTIKFLEELIK